MLSGRFGYFLFFSALGRGREGSEAPGRGGGSRDVGGGGRGWEGIWGGFGNGIFQEDYYQVTITSAAPRCVSPVVVKNESPNLIGRAAVRSWGKTVLGLCRASGLHSFTGFCGHGLPLGSEESGVAPANQTKERPAHELFTGASKVRYVNRACFP